MHNEQQSNRPELNLTKLQSQSLALAALIQASELVRQLAHTSDANEFQVRPLIHSLFKFNVAQSAEIYGDLRLLEQGFNRLYTMLNGQLNDIDKDILKYSMGIISLADELIQNNQMSNQLRMRLTHVTYPIENEWLELPSEINNIYKDTISTLSYRIQITGDPRHLKNTLTSSRIRTLLLAGVRAAILWRQLDGSKFSLFFQRNKMKDAISTLSPINKS